MGGHNVCPHEKDTLAQVLVRSKFRHYFESERFLNNPWRPSSQRGLWVIVRSKEGGKCDQINCFCNRRGDLYVSNWDTRF